MLTTNIIDSIDKCILCWLATADGEGMPNVSPKEIFTHHEDHVLVANICSPQTVANIKVNNKVCLSFVDIFVQKGYQLKGETILVEKEDSGFSELEKPLLAMTKGAFPIISIIKIKVIAVKEILAPSYLLYPDTSEKDQIKSALKAYRVEQLLGL